MSKLFIVKISSSFEPQQVEKNFVAAGSRNSAWYGGLNEGDYVIVIHERRLKKLWKAKEFKIGFTVDNTFNQDGAWYFETVKKFDNPIGIQQILGMYPYFEMDLNLLNKSTKQSKNVGFFELKLSADTPPIEDITFDKKRRIYIELKTAFSKIAYKENDVRISLNNKTDMAIMGIDIHKSGGFQRFESLNDLYESKNTQSPKPTIRELFEYAKQEDRKHKINYLKKVITTLEGNRHFEVVNPIKLYDNILVGLKNTTTRASGTTPRPPIGSEEEDFLEELLPYKSYREMLDFNPNMILYGVPGTGKTYAAQKIIEYAEYLHTKEYKPFAKLQEEQRVEFVTFHQAFSYEEFVEGLRPVMLDDEDSDHNGMLHYRVESGILKRMANNASAGQIRLSFKETALESLTGDKKVWKVSLGGRNDATIYNRCIQKEYIAIGWFDDKNLNTIDNIYQALKQLNPNSNPTNDNATINDFLNNMSKGDIVFIYDGKYTIRDIGVIVGDYKYLGNQSYAHTRKVKWLKHFSTPMNIAKYNRNTGLTMKTIYHLWRVSMSDVNELLQSDNTIEVQNHIEETPPYFLIIDEINRGNIAKIFGELITLLEKDKRDVLKCTLPYSRKPFTLPHNLYIIGTMNTADRSIAAIDTALRRRFIFKEINPDVSVISSTQIGDPVVDLPSLLTAINEKITINLDRDHRIGHSYFLDIDTVDDLRKVWYLQVIPLLMEYFYFGIDNIQKIITNKFIAPNGNVIEYDHDTDFLNALIAIYHTA